MKQLKLTFLLAIAIFSQNLAMAQPAGTGTAADPYQISSIDDLVWFSANTNLWTGGKYFIQTNNIDAASAGNFSPIGNSLIGANVNYDGQNFTISNLNISKAGPLVGLFGYLTGGSLKNIKLNKANINCSATPGLTYVGALVGFNSGTIFNCHVYESVVLSTGDMVGGLVGTSTNTIEQCYVWTHSTGRANVGGIAGSLDGGTIRSCYPNGKFTASGEAAGGICGLLSNGALISNCYTKAAETSAFNYAGGIGGKIGNGSGKIEYCYSASDVAVTTTGTKYRGAVSGDAGITQVNNLYDYLQSYNGNMGTGSTAKTTGAFWLISTFTNEGWDFLCETANGTNDYWKLKAGDNAGFPRLTWDGAPYSDNCKEWNGNLSTDWNTSGNWTPAGAPSAGEAIYIRGNADNNPILPGNVQLSNVIFGSETGTTRLILGNYNLTVGKIMNARAENYVRTDGTGTVIKTLANGESFTFPIGISGYSPVTVSNNTGASDVFNARVTNAVYKNGVSGATMSVNGVRRTWNVGKTNPNAGSGVTMKFDWIPTDVTGLFITPEVWHYNSAAPGGAKWESYPNITTRKGNSATITGYMDAFSPFIVVDNTIALPVTWADISVSQQGENALLKWSTLSEENTKFYFVQHSVNGRNWNTIGTVNAAGNANDAAHYQYLHNSPSNGMNYYRVMQQEVTGGQSISKVVTLQWSLSSSLKIFPNPATDATIQVITNEAGMLQFFTSTGVMVKEVQVKAGKNTVDVSGLVSGAYLVKVGELTIILIVK